jgi:spore maturation protein CgeB
MRIFIPQISWIGNFFQYFKSAFEGIDIEIGTNTNQLRKNPVIRALKLHQVEIINRIDTRKAIGLYNDQLLKKCVEFKPDLFLVYNESKLYPDTIEAIKKKCKCIMAVIVADDPWDSIRYKTDFPHSLKYFDFIFNSDPLWNINIKKVAPQAKIYWHTLGFDPDIFLPTDDTLISSSDKASFECDVSFTGSSYGSKAEGAYRSDVLSFLTDFDLRIWGDDNWPYRFRYLPNLKKCFKGNRLPYEDLRKLFKLSKVNMNIPAPQILSGFQPRVFEIAACKGFQIADYRPLLRKLFTEDELVTFDTIDELREKTKYYLQHDEERKEISERLYAKVIQTYTWKHWAKKLVDTIMNPDAFENL